MKYIRLTQRDTIQQGDEYRTNWGTWRPIEQEHIGKQKGKVFGHWLKMRRIIQKEETMSIFLGNLSIEEIESRSGVKFPEGLVEYMKPRKQEKAANIKHGKWHCFDIPFNLVCGDMVTAKKIYDYLKPLSKDFKEQLQISLDEK